MTTVRPEAELSAPPRATPASGRTDDPALPGRSEAGLRRSLGYGDLVAIGVGGIIGSGWLFSVLSAANVAGPASIWAWVIGGGISVLLALAWAELGGIFPQAGTTARVPYYTHGSFLGFQLSWIRYLAVATIPAIEAEAVVTATAAIFDRWHVPIFLTTATRFGTERFASLTPLGVLVAAGLVFGFLLLNLAGIRALGRANRWVTVWKVAVPLVTAVTLLTVFRAGNLTSTPGGVFPYGPASVVAAVGTSGIMFAYLGFAQMLDFGGEARRPGLDMPRALLTAVLLATGVYCTLSIAFLGAVRWTGAGLAVGDWAGLGASPWANLPLYYAVAANGGLAFGLVGLLLLVDAGVSPSGTGWIYLGVSTRALFGWADESRLPKRLTEVDARGVPWLALGVSTAVGLLFLLPLPSWYELVGFLSSATILTYVVGSLAVPALRRTAGELPRPFRLPWAGFVAPAGFVAAALVLFWAGFQLLSWMVALAVVGEIVYLVAIGPQRHGLARSEALGAGLLLALGLALWAYLGPLVDRGTGLGTAGGALASPLWSRTAVGPDVLALLVAALLLVVPWAYLLRRDRGEGRRSLRAAAWFPAWLAVLFPLTYLGEFGPQFASGSATLAYPWARVLPFPVGTAAAAALAGVVYAWAVRAAYRTEELEAREGLPGR